MQGEVVYTEAAGARFKLITTDGVFSMDGTIARLDEICDPSLPHTYARTHAHAHVTLSQA